MILRVLLFSILSTALFATPANAAALGFQEWKSARIDESKAKLDRTQLDIQIEKVPSSSVRAPIAASDKSHTTTVPQKVPQGRTDQRLQQAQLNYEIAQELTLNDYFTLYVAQLGDKASVVEAAKKLNPDEVAELLLTYQKQLSGAQAGEAPPASLFSSSARPQDPKGSHAQ